MDRSEVIKIINRSDIFTINYLTRSQSVNKSKCDIVFTEDNLIIGLKADENKLFLWYDLINSIDENIQCNKHNVKLDIDHEGTYHCQECRDDNDLKRILKKRNLIIIEKVDLKNLREDINETGDTVNWDKVDKFFEKYLVR